MMLPTVNALRKKTQSLKFRIKFYLMILLLLVVIFPLALLIYQLDKNHDEFSTNLVETTTHAVYQSIFDALMNNNPEQIQQALENYRYKTNIEGLRIYRPNGDIIFSSNPSEVGNNFLKMDTAAEHIHSLPGGARESFVRSGNTLSHQHPVYIQKECAPCHTNFGEMIAIMDVQVGLAESETMYSSTRRLLVASAGLIFIILWVSINILFETQIENRILNLMNGFQALAKGKLETEVDIKGTDELGLLAQEFNRTVAQLRQSKMREEELIRENLARADRLITMGEVTAEIAHEVNNPAGIILNRAELIRDELHQHGNGVSGYVSDMDIIIKQTERIAQTTHGILQFARKLPDQLQIVDLTEVINVSVDMIKPKIKKSNIQISLSGFGSPVLTMGNFNQLQQVFCNLITNSLDAVAPEAGRISVSLETVSNPEGVAQHRIVFSDNGSGIPASVKQDIFSAFFTTKSPGKGTGLGLFIVRNIITRHNGRIYLDEDCEIGTTFIIELEARDE